MNPMKLNFDRIMSEALGVKAPAILVGDREYTLRDFSIGEAAIFERVRAPTEGESEQAFSERLNKELASYFAGDAPPFLSEPLPPPEDEDARRLHIRRTWVLGMMISGLITEMVSLPKQMARAAEAIQQQIQATRGLD